MTIYNTSNIWEALDAYPFTHIRLENEGGKMIIPFPSRTVTKDDRIKEIKKFFASDHAADGFYNIIVKSGANGEKTFFKVLKKYGLIRTESRITFKEIETKNCFVFSLICSHYT